MLVGKETVPNFELFSRNVDLRPWNGHIYGKSISELLRTKLPTRLDVIECINRLLKFNPNNNFIKDVRIDPSQKKKNPISFSLF